MADMAAIPREAVTKNHPDRVKINFVDLVAQVYESAGDPVGLSAFIRDAATHFGAQSSAVAIWSEDRNHGVLSVTHGLRPEALNLLFNRRHETGTLFSHLRKLQSGEAVAIAARQHSTSTHPDSENEYAAMHLLSGLVTLQGGTPCAIILFRSNQDDAFSAADKDALANLMHFYGRAFRINKRFIQIHDERKATKAALEFSPRGIIFLDKHGRVAHTNNSARIILDKNDGLRQSDNVIRIDDSAAQKEFDDFIAAAGLRAETNRPSSVICRVPRRSSAAAYQLIVAEIPGSLPRSALNDDELVAMAVIHNPDDLVDLGAKYLRTFYELSPAEARLARALYRVKSLTGAAKSLDISIHTARSELKNIFKKVGVNSQSALLVEFAKALKD